MRPLFRISDSYLILTAAVFIILPALLGFSAISISSSFGGQEAASNTQSPSFGRQEVANTISQWTDMYTGRLFHKGPQYTNITSVTYSSDGRFLNATLWLSSLNNLTLVNNRASPVGLINYGMMIDSDLDDKSGLQGVDYELQIQWSKANPKWTRTFFEYSHAGSSRNVSSPIDNTANFFEDGGKYVKLDLDLRSILFPSKYKVFFYAFSYDLEPPSYTSLKKEHCCLLNAVRWIFIPPPEFSIRTLPSSLDVIRGEKTHLDLLVNSTTGFQPNVTISIPNSPKYLNVTPEDRLLKLPTYTVATTTLFLDNTSNVHTGQHTVDVLGTFDFLNQSFTIPNTNSNVIINPDNVTTKTTFNLKLEDAPGLLQKIGETWNQVGGVLNFVYVPAAAAIAWFVGRRTKKKS
jgi:hypothetical protein